MKQERRGCGICGSADSRLLFRQDFASISGGSFLDGYDVVICSACGFGYADDLPDQSVFDRHYREMSKYEYEDQGGKEPEHDLGRFKRLAAIVLETCPALGARILDIGCATGQLLALLKQEGYPHVLGLDPSPTCAAIARRLYDIDVVTGSIDESTLPKEAFDYLILSGVLEHIRDLSPVLKRLRGLLAADGQMLICVPDAARFAEEDDAPFQQFSTEHVNFFSSQSLTSLMSANGFTAVVCQHNEFKEGKGYTQVGPVVDAVFRKTDGLAAAPPRDVVTEPALAEYIRKSQAVDDGIRRTIDEILTAGKPILVWGTGTHTLRLLATSRLREAAITAFIDSNPRYHNKDLNGIPIIGPAGLAGRTEPILISSRVFQQDIHRQIREVLQLSNPIHLLYAV